MRWLFPFAGLVFISVGIPFYLEKVGPNGISGLRTSKTLSDPNIWYAANRVMGLDFIVSGMILLLVCIVLLTLASSNPNLNTTRINTLLIFIALLYIALHGFWSLSRM
jgi:uncharacterized membrane protein